MSDGERRLAAIMFTDIVGYTALTQANESQAMDVLERHNRLLRPFFPKFHGKEVKAMGDSFLVEFESALDAIRCATEIQSYLHDYNVSSREWWKIKLRIGIHLGDVIHQAGDVFGDAVNIASRIEPEVGPEEIGVSQQVYDQVQNKFDLPLVSLGERFLKNVSMSLTVYKVQMPWEGKRMPSALDMHRIAILPLLSISPDPNDEYFADGLTEELIDRLSQVKGLEVIARTSVMSYRKREKKAVEIGSELKAGALLEGSVRKVGNGIRVTAQLIDANTEGHVWSSRYDRELKDIFAVQSDIALQVVSALEIQLLPHEKRAIEKEPTENTEAYSNFLRGRELLRDGSETALRQAVGLFGKATELDPSFAKAHVGLANCHEMLATRGYEPWDAMFPLVKAPLTLALELDPDLAEAHASLSVLLYFGDDFVGAAVEARRALELNPSLPEPYQTLSNLALLKGETDEAVRLAEAAYRMDPIRSEYIRLAGRVYLSTGREHELTEHWKRTEQLAPESTHMLMTEYYLSKGDVGKGKESYAKVEKLHPTNLWVTWMGGVIAAQEGDKEKALLAIKKLEEAKLGPVTFNVVGYIYHALGDFDTYFILMNKSLEAHVLPMHQMMYSPLFAKSRTDPRYQELVERMRTAGGLVRDGQSAT